MNRHKNAPGLTSGGIINKLNNYFCCAGGCCWFCCCCIFCCVSIIFFCCSICCAWYCAGVRTSTTSTSKIKFSLGLILSPWPFFPYAREDGINNIPLLPFFICFNPSVQPKITLPICARSTLIGCLCPNFGSVFESKTLSTNVLPV